MKHRRQDLIPIFLHQAGVSQTRLLLSRIQGRAIIRFIAFHDIPPGAASSFREKLKVLKELTNVISIDDYFAGRVSTRRVNIVVTFDDGYKSWSMEAAPALKELQLPAIFFISSGFVGLSGASAQEFVRKRLRLAGDTTGPLAAADVRQLADEGFSIGGHTYSHVNLTELGEDEVRKEIMRDKEALEALTGSLVSYFAYPFGAAQHSSVNLARLIEESGYKAAVTTRSGLSTDRTDKFAIHRELTSAAMSNPAFVARLYGNQDAVRMVKSGARALVKAVTS